MAEVLEKGSLDREAGNPQYPVAIAHSWVHHLLGVDRLHNLVVDTLQAAQVARIGHCPHREEGGMVLGLGRPPAAALPVLNLPLLRSHTLAQRKHVSFGLQPPGVVVGQRMRSPHTRVVGETHIVHAAHGLDSQVAVSPSNLSTRKDFRNMCTYVLDKMECHGSLDIKIGAQRVLFNSSRN